MSDLIERIDIHGHCGEGCVACDLLKEARVEIVEYRTVLQKLRNDAAGVAGMTEARTVFGNTNLACLEQRIREADQLLQTKGE